MARTRSGQALIDDAYVLTDLTSFTTRHPRSEVLRHINQGGAELWDLLIESMGKAYGRSATPWTITTTADTIEYTSGYPATLLNVISVRMDEPYKEQLSRLASPEEAYLRTETSATYPKYYDMIPGGIQLFPSHQSGLSVVVEYVKAYTDLTDAADSYFDGIDGWEDYLVHFAAKRMFIKEGEPEMVREMNNELAALRDRIKKRAPARDQHRARRSRDIRGEKLVGIKWWRQ